MLDGESMKDLKYLQLWDSYGGLLTENQREVCELYYVCDLSLSEIAEQKGVSRQSVSDTLAKSRALLDGYEEKVRHNAENAEYRRAVGAMMTDVCCALEAFGRRHPEHAKEMDEIAQLVTVGERIAPDEKDEG